MQRAGLEDSAPATLPASLSDESLPQTPKIEGIFMSSIREQIIQKIKRNRISTTQVADCLDKTGAIDGLRALTSGHHKVGPVFWTYAYNESNWELHDQVREAPEGSIVITETFNCGQRAVYGELVSKY